MSSLAQQLSQTLNSQSEDPFSSAELDALQQQLSNVTVTQVQQPQPSMKADNNITAPTATLVTVTEPLIPSSSVVEPNQNQIDTNQVDCNPNNGNQTAVKEGEKESTQLESESHMPPVFSSSASPEKELVRPAHEPSPLRSTGCVRHPLEDVESPLPTRQDRNHPRTRTPSGDFFLMKSMSLPMGSDPMRSRALSTGHYPRGARGSISSVNDLESNNVSKK